MNPYPTDTDALDELTANEQRADTLEGFISHLVEIRDGMKASEFDVRRLIEFIEDAEAALAVMQDDNSRTRESFKREHAALARDTYEH
jgi:hypothetical protein